MPTFLSRPLFDFQPNFEDLGEGWASDATGDAQGFGLDTGWVNQLYTQRTFKINLQLHGRAEIRALEAFIDGVRGRLQGFWFPTASGDLRLTRDVLATDLEVQFEDCGLRAIYAEHPGLSFAALVDENFITPIRFSSVNVDSAGKEKATLTSVAGRAHKMAQTKLSWLVYVRFQRDEVRMNFITDDIAEVSLDLIELPTEYAAQELGDRPVFLYEITQGDLVRRWTSYGADLTAAGQDWIKEDVNHSDITRSTEFLDEGVKLQCGLRTADNPFRQFVAGAPVQTMSVKIFKTVAPSFPLSLDLPLYEGDVQEVFFMARGQLSVKLSSVLRISDYTVPRVIIHKLCNWSLYDPPTCGLGVGSYETTGTLSVVTGTYVEAAAFGAKATAQSDANWFALGKIKVGNEVRSVVSQTGNRLFINVAFRSASVGASAKAYAGCDKQRNTCKNKFNNLIRHGGFPYVALKNPQMDALKPPQQNGSGGKK